jgi:DNA recombination protein RmuC
VLGKIRDQTQSVIKTLDAADTRSRAMTRALRGVEAMPEVQAQALLPSAELAGQDNGAMN